MRTVTAALALLALAAAPATADDLAARFAARPTAIQVALSPDGDKIVYIGATKTGGRAVPVADLKTGEARVVMASSNIDITPSHCGFKSETRLVCTLYGVLNLGAGNASLTRVVAIDVDGKNMTLLTQRTGVTTGSVFNGGRSAIGCPTILSIS